MPSIFTEDLKSFLDDKVIQYNKSDFIDSDPIQIPHLFTLKEDIEISAFLVATISWGNRKMIIKNGHKMIEIMGNSPFDFVMNANEDQLRKGESFVHRTFNGVDFITFIFGLRHIYSHYQGLEHVFFQYQDSESLSNSISKLKTHFFEIPHQFRTQKHISDPMKGSAAKRIHMFLRWMIRKDATGVDFGIWNSILPAKLSCPLDVHSGNVARKLGLLLRKQNDAKALLELDTALRKLDPLDPVKYDFALFGLGVFEGF